MDLETFTIAVYCLMDDLLHELADDPDWRRVRHRGPAPVRADGEVLTMEVAGEFLGLDQDVAIYQYFRRDRSIACAGFGTVRNHHDGRGLRILH